MKSLLLMMSLCVSFHAIAHDDEQEDQWLCTQEKSQMQGDKILVCGTAAVRPVNSGGGDIARRDAEFKATQDAKNEFSSICSGSSCRKYEYDYTIIPGRMTCHKLITGPKLKDKNMADMFPIGNGNAIGCLHIFLTKTKLKKMNVKHAIKSHL